ncbi:ATP-grasp domain-containing protein [Candidatus Bipolaricaulota bacterium]|nr:ATP-grasp domain-containing protein [Candidatus Bipolaricaulota bacterium]
MRVLVTGLFEVATVFAIRRFAELGCEVTAADGHRLAFSMYSKDVSNRVRLPNMRKSPSAYAEALIRELERGRYDYYYPGYEEIILLAHYQDRIKQLTRTTIPDLKTIMRLHDKAQLAELANKIGVATPETYAPSTPDEAREIIANIDGPVIIKQRQSSGASGMRRLESRKEIEDWYFHLVSINHTSNANLPIIQRIIDGETICTLELANQGDVVGEVLIRTLRSHPREEGSSVFRESIRQPACEDAAAKVLRELRFSGLCGFDFIIESGTGTPYLVDGNPRQTPSLNLAYHAGCDMIGAWLDIAAGRTPETLPLCREGVRTKTQFGDFVWLLESYLGSLKDWRGERKLRKEWWASKDFTYDITSLRDPMPLVVLWVYILSNVYKLALTSFDPTQLLMYHNMYVENGALRAESRQTSEVKKTAP